MPPKEITEGEPKRKIIAQSVSFSGPLPPPGILENYERICPGSADRIISMAEKQAEHRKGLENKVVNSDISNSKSGLWLGFIIALVLIICGAFLVYNNHSITGFIMLFGTPASLVGIFVYGHKKRENGKDNKKQ